MNWSLAPLLTARADQKWLQSLRGPFAPLVTWSSQAPVTTTFTSQLHSTLSVSHKCENCTLTNILKKHLEKCKGNSLRKGFNDSEANLPWLQLGSSQSCLLIHNCTEPNIQCNPQNYKKSTFNIGPGKQVNNTNPCKY